MASMNQELEVFNDRVKGTLQKLQNIALTYVDVGEDLYYYKQHIEHGQWSEWVEKTFPLSQNSATRFIRIYEEWGGRRDEIEGMALRTVLALSKKGVSEEAKKKAIEEHQSGGKVTVDRVNQIRDEQEGSIIEEPNEEETESKNVTLVDESEQLESEEESDDVTFDELLYMLDDQVGGLEFAIKALSRYVDNHKLIQSEVASLKQRNIKLINTTKELKDIYTGPKDTGRAPLREYISDSESIMLTELLAESINKNCPDAKIPAPQSVKYNKWLDDIKELARYRQSGYEKIAEVIKWVHNHESKDGKFKWGTYIQSPSGLNKHFPTLTSNMGTGNNDHPKGGITVDDNEDWGNNTPQY